MNLQEKLELAERVAREAGRNLLRNRAFRVERKAKFDFVTEMDQRTERFIREALLGACPEDSFYGEEYGAAGDGASGGTWIVDPIDGTTNFIRDLPAYAVSIGYQLAGELVLGCVYWPVLDEMYLARKGQGATRNGAPIHVSNVAEADEAIVGISFCHRSGDDHARVMRLLNAMSVGDVRRFGSAALDLCMVACGRQDAFVELGLELYDIAAGIVILREAGGSAEGWPGEEGCEVTGNVLAGNGLVNGYFAKMIGE